MFDPALTRALALVELPEPSRRNPVAASVHGAGEAGAVRADADAAPADAMPVGTASTDPLVAGHLGRVVARSSDRVAWLRARSRGITATDVAKLSTPRSVMSAAYDKLHGTGFGGNVYTQHGRNSAHNVQIGGDATVFAPNYGSPFVHDLDAGRRLAVDHVRAVSGHFDRRAHLVK